VFARCSSQHTILNQLYVQVNRGKDNVGRGVSHLNGARFSMPSSEIDDTNAIGLGTTPLVRIEYNLLAYAVSAEGHTARN